MSGCRCRPGAIRIQPPPSGQSPMSVRRPRIFAQVYEQPLEAGRRVAAKGQQDVIERHNSAHRPTRYPNGSRPSGSDRRSRVISLPGASETATTGPLAVPPAPVSIEQLEAMLIPLGRDVDVAGDRRGPIIWMPAGVFAQRALFRALRPLWFQQHQFHAQVVSALRLTMVRFGRSSEHVRSSTPGYAS